MAILVFETSTERAIVALYKGSVCQYMAGLPIGYHNSRFLMPKIQEALNVCSMSFEEIEGIAVGVGPGSYTGIRVGAIAAKAMSWAKKIPLVGVCTLKTFLPIQDGLFASMIDAKISGAYVMLGEKKGSKVHWLSEPLCMPLDQLEQFLKGVEVIITPNKERIERLLREKFPENRWIWQESAPDGQWMAEEFYQAKARGEFTVDGSLNLLYLRNWQSGG